VQFVPVVADGVKAPISSGTTDEKGFFRLIRDDNGKPGAIIGKHKVVVVTGRLDEGTRSRDEQESAPGRTGTVVPRSYSSVAQTPLEVEVKPDQTNYPLQISDGSPRP
jgi:hypothetical protein